MKTYFGFALVSNPFRAGGEALGRPQNLQSVNLKVSNPFRAGGEALETKVPPPTEATLSFKPLQSGR